MIRQQQYRRLIVLAVLLVAAFAGLGYRLVQLQVLRHDELSALAQKNTLRRFFYEPRRGDILDCKGNLLATTSTVKRVCADPTLIGNHQAEVARALAPLLHLNAGDLYQQLLPRIRTNDKGETITNQYVRLENKVPSEVWDKIQSVMSHLDLGKDKSHLTKRQQAFNRALRQKSIFAEDYPLRSYPNQSLASQVLGFAVTRESVMDGHVMNVIEGRDGIELTLNSRLCGVPGWRLTETDSHGRELISLREQDVEPRDGLNVVLTIDSVIQNIVESALAEAMEQHTPISAAGVVIRPSTGEILAMATLPTFNPNNLNTVTPDTRDRIITDVMEPGSTFKIVTVSGALNDGIVNLDDTVYCEHGRFPFAGRVLHDHEPYDALTVEGVITKSSNIGAAKLGIRLGENRLYDYISGYGFGAGTGLPLPGEVAGIVHAVKNWSKVSVAQLPMGQGIAVTRLQMALAMCAIANHGVLMAPMLVNRLEDPDGHVVARYSPQAVRQVIRKPTAKNMVEALKTVVTSEGTAPKAALEHYTVAGKTGTAQKVENGVYVHNKFFASFIGFFPADNPQVCISIVLDEPKGGYYGGQVAAPVFKEIAERVAGYLNIPPDIGPSAPEALTQTEAPAGTVTVR